MFGDVPFANPATASSGLAVTYGSDKPEVAAVNPSTGEVTIKGAGTAHMLANQPGNASFSPAPGISQTLTVNKASQTITFDLGNGLLKHPGDAPFPNPAKAGSGLPVTFSSGTPSVANVDPVTGVVTVKGLGTTHILAVQAGNQNEDGSELLASAMVGSTDAALGSYRYVALNPPVELAGGPVI